MKAVSDQDTKADVEVAADAAAVVFSAVDANASSSLSYFFAAVVVEILAVKIKLWRSILSGAIVISFGFFS